MKKFITPAYTFTPGASGVGTVDLSGISSFDKKNLVAIINQTLGVVIYATGSANTKYTNVTGTTVTLFFDTSTHSGSDILQVIYEDNDAAQVVSAASLPLPTGAATESGNLATIVTSLYSIDAGIPSALGQTTMTSSMPVVLASNQSAIPVTSGANINGSNTDSTVSTVTTITPPSNSVGFILMNLDTSTANVRWRIGATATASSGSQLQPGRDTGFIPCAANISLCSESGTNNYNIQWILSS
ncbi:MAG: hypothetical protein IPQ08_05840 [Chitinophagaceae bacterium]|nr:hypothetical protein [Chitinophagaceae bacterium]